MHTKWRPSVGFLLYWLQWFDHSQAGPPSTQPPPEIVFRGDHRPPSAIKEMGGFQPKNPQMSDPASVSLLRHAGAEGVQARTNAAYVMTTARHEIAISNIGAPGGYVYEIAATPNFVDCWKTLSPYYDGLRGDRPYSALGGVVWTQVRGWWHYPQGNRLNAKPTSFEKNPDYNPKFDKFTASGEVPQLSGFPAHHSAWKKDSWKQFDPTVNTKTPVQHAYEFLDQVGAELGWKGKAPLIPTADMVRAAADEVAKQAKVAKDAHKASMASASVEQSQAEANRARQAAKDAFTEAKKIAEAAATQTDKQMNLFHRAWNKVLKARKYAVRTACEVAHASADTKWLLSGSSLKSAKALSTNKVDFEKELERVEKTITSFEQEISERVKLWNKLRDELAQPAEGAKATELTSPVDPLTGDALPVEKEGLAEEEVTEMDTEVAGPSKAGTSAAKDMGEAEAGPLTPKAGEETKAGVGEKAELSDFGSAANAKFDIIQVDGKEPTRSGLQREMQALKIETLALCKYIEPLTEWLTELKEAEREQAEKAQKQELEEEKQKKQKETKEAQEKKEEQRKAKEAEKKKEQEEKAEKLRKEREEKAERVRQAKEEKEQRKAAEKEAKAARKAEALKDAKSLEKGEGFLSKVAKGVTTMIGVVAPGVFALGATASGTAGTAGTAGTVGTGAGVAGVAEPGAGDIATGEAGGEATGSRELTAAERADVEEKAEIIRRLFGDMIKRFQEGVRQTEVEVGQLVDLSVSEAAETVELPLSIDEQLSQAPAPPSSEPLAPDTELSDMVASKAGKSRAGSKQKAPMLADRRRRRRSTSTSTKGESRAARKLQVDVMRPVVEFAVKQILNEVLETVRKEVDSER